jgi:hypothetical protein
LYNADCFLPVLRPIKLTEVFELFEMS